MRKIFQTISCLFVRNNLGWILAVANLIALHFFFWYLQGGLHNPMATGCVEGKFTMISTFRHYQDGIVGVLSDMTSLFLFMLNLPALYLSDFVSNTLFSGRPVCIQNEGQPWQYTIFYQFQIALNVLFIIIQWLLVGAVIKRLVRLVKESD